MTTLQPIPESLAGAHAWARSQPWLSRFTLMNRILLAMAFIPTGLVKATGNRFTILPVTDPVGFFFEAMYQTGPWWHFIGFSQIAAAVMLLVPATATVGAILALPIAVSIFLITWGVGFHNTVYIGAGMVVSVTYLLCWDADRIWNAGSMVLGRRSSPALLAGAHIVEKLGWGLGSATGLALFMVTRGFVPNTWIRGLLLVGVGSVGLVVAGWLAGAWRSRVRPDS